MIHFLYLKITIMHGMKLLYVFTVPDGEEWRSSAMLYYTEQEDEPRRGR